MNKKTILVTGASRGIGAEIARMFARDGYNVAFCYKNSDDKAEALVKELENFGASVYMEKFDISCISKIKAFVENVIKHFGKIDVLVNNAGIAKSSLLIDMDDDEIISVLNTNLTASIVFSKETAKNMISNGFGRIINISSIWGVSGAAMEAVYSASKAGIIGFTQGLSKEIGSAGVTVNAIAPGLIDTDMNSDYNDEEINDIISQISVGRIGKTEDIASLALFLAGDSAGFINGQCITVDGGFVR